MNSTTSGILYQAGNVWYDQKVNGYYLHLNGSTLKVGLYDGTGSGRFLTEELLPTACSHSKIIDPEEFAKEFKRILAVHYGENLPKLPLVFILEPEVTELFLLTGNKQAINPEQEARLMENQIKDRLVDEHPDDLYISEYKIAPFIYQFVGIKKSTLDAILEVGRLVDLEIGGIFPLGLVLAKTNADVSSMFILPRKDEVTAVFSELTGITFAEKFSGKLSLDELIELFWKLSVYNTKATEVKIYSFAKYEQNFTSDDSVNFLEGGLENDYEELALTQALLEKNPAFLHGQGNLLNILPVPVLAEKSKAPVIAGAGILSFLLIGSLVIQLTVGFDTLFGKKSGGQSQEVLAEQQQSQTPAPTPSEQPNPNSSQQDQEPVKPKEVKRSDLTLRVENGNGVPGSAGKLKAYLEGFGYKVLEPGNADKIDYTTTTVKLPKELSDYKDLLTNDLKTNYSVEIVELDTRPSEYDVLVIVGQN